MNRLGGFLILAAVLAGGCQPTYPEQRLIEGLKRICHEEYGIDDVHVVIKGETLGVHLPLRKLFSADFERLLRDGAEIQDLESLMQLHPDALEKIDNVFFSTSRVILSTDKKINFYVITATDTELTGLQITRVGYVDDLKRVRFWDISRGEFFKRLHTDFSLNRGVIWKKPVVTLFNALGLDDPSALLAKSFSSAEEAKLNSPLFYSEVIESNFKKDLIYQISDIKSTSLSRGEIVVYLKAKGTYEPKAGYESYKFLLPSGFEAEYMFLLERSRGQPSRIVRVIPFYFVNDQGEVEKILFPEAVSLYRSIDNWMEDFTVEDVKLPEFLANQLTRRMQALLNADERVYNTFHQARAECMYDTDASRFRLSVRVLPKRTIFRTASDVRADDDLQYLLGLLLKEFARVMRSYRFDGFKGLDLSLPLSEEAISISTDLIEGLRQDKVSIRELLTSKLVGV